MGCLVTDDLDRWVKNYSDRNLSDDERAVLAKGLNFAVTPTKLPVVDIITSTETAIRNAGLDQGQAETLCRLSLHPHKLSHTKWMATINDNEDKRRPALLHLVVFTDM